MFFLGRTARWAAAKLLRIDQGEVSFARRGFHASSPEACEHLEAMGRAFLAGYHAALDAPDLEQLGDRLSAIEGGTRGFAFEGAAMALALLDRLLPSRGSRWQAFLAGAGSCHSYVLHVGYGWALARLPWLRRRAAKEVERFDPYLRWLVLDGFGFHEGFFHARRFVDSAEVPARLTGRALCAFDQGLGRSLWFSAGADVARIKQLVDALAPARRADLWSGVGLACAYAGDAREPELAQLSEAAGTHRLHLCQGITFAAEARHLASIPACHTERACRVLMGMDAETAARLTYSARNRIGSNTPRDAFYELWRSNVRDCLQEDRFPDGNHSVPEPFAVRPDHLS